MEKQDPQGSQTLSSLKSLKIQNPPSIPISEMAYKILGGQTEKNVQIELQTTEITSKEATCPLVSESATSTRRYREAELLKMLHPKVVVFRIFV